MSSTGISKRSTLSLTPSLVYPRMLGYTFGLVMHLINVISMMNTFKGDLLQDAAVRRFHDDQSKFLTIWNVYLQTLYCALGLSCDVLSLTNEAKDSSLLKTLKRIRDPLFSSLVFPVSLTVATVFWTCFSYERTLILPPSVDQALSWSSNHVIHTAIVPLVLWELVFRPRRAPESHVLNLGLICVYVGGYMAVIITSYLTLGAWVYPILDLLDGTIYLYLFFATCVVIILAYYSLQWYLTDLLWGSRDGMKKVN